MMKRVLFLLFLSFAVRANAGEVYLGILAEPQSGGELSSKILFVKKENEWRSVANEFYRLGKFEIPDVTPINWTIAFDGRSLGRLKLIDPDPSRKFINPWHYSRDKVFSIKGNQEIPKIENKSKQFGGWVKVPDNRPLVLVSKPNYSDPEHWKPIDISASLKRSLFVPLKLVMGKFNAYRCPDGPEINKSVPYTFKYEDMVIYKAYGSMNKIKLVAVGMNREKYGCDGPRPPEWGDNWFLIDGDNIDFLGREMNLVDAGDYDSDGKSEILFWHSGYNEDGYILMFNSFTEKAEFIWGYH